MQRVNRYLRNNYEHKKHVTNDKIIQIFFPLFIYLTAIIYIADNVIKNDVDINICYITYKNSNSFSSRSPRIEHKIVNRAMTHYVIIIYKFNMYIIYIYKYIYILYKEKFSNSMYI